MTLWDVVSQYVIPVVGTGGIITLFTIGVGFLRAGLQWLQTKNIIALSDREQAMIDGYLKKATDFADEFAHADIKTNSGKGLVGPGKKAELAISMAKDLINNDKSFAKTVDDGSARRLIYAYLRDKRNGK